MRTVIILAVIAASIITAITIMVNNRKTQASLDQLLNNRALLNNNPWNIQETES